MKVLLTGATGFIGSHTLEALLRAGHDVRLLVRDREKMTRLLAARGLVVEDVVVGDMTDAAVTGEALNGCDAVIHSAAAMYGRGDVLHANAFGVRNLVGAACERELDPVVYVSTIAALFPPPGPVMTVDDPVVEPKTLYGRSKAEGEHYVRELQARGAPVVIVYPAAVHGPEDPVFGEGSKGLRDRVRYGWPITSGGTGCVDVRDVAEILVAALERGRGPRRYMAGGNFLTWREESDICERVVGRRVRRVWAPAALVHAVARLLDLLRKFVTIDYPLTSEAAHFVTLFTPCDNRGTEEELGVVFRPAEETLRDAITWLLASGELTPAHAPRLADPSNVAIGSGRDSG